MPQALRAIPLRGPGRFGLNTQQAADTADPRWALELTNAVFDDAGRIAARKGFDFLTTGEPHDDETLSIIEYIKDKDTVEILSAAGTGFWEGTTTLSDIKGSVTTPPSADWQFRNFNGKVVGVIQGNTPIVYSGTTFDDLGGSENPYPQGNCSLAAWGRMWIAEEDRKGILVSALLDENDYTITLDLQDQWPDGQDLVVAIEELQDQLLVFGERNILVFTRPDDIATTPNSAFALVDTIDSGALNRNAVVRVGNDIIYLSNDGLRSVGRAIQYESLPSSLLSTNVRDRLIDDIAAASDFRLAYSEAVGGILGKVGTAYWYFDVKNPLETGDLRASSWDTIGWTAAAAATDGTIYLGDAGGVGTYSGFTDRSTEDQYTFRFRGTWLEEDARTFIPKSAKANLITSTNTNINLSWAFDFEDAINTDQQGTGAAVSIAEWNVAEWNNAEWSSGGFTVRRTAHKLYGTGERLQMGLIIPVQGAVSVAQIDIFYKLGRLAA